MATKAATVPFSTAEQEAIQRAAYAVWEYCAGDLLQAVAEEKGKTAEQVTIPRSQVVEIALDAGRTEDHLKRSRDSRDLGVVTPEFLARFNAASYEQLKRIVRPAFPYARYGY